MSFTVYIRGPCGAGETAMDVLCTATVQAMKSHIAEVLGVAVADVEMVHDGEVISGADEKLVSETDLVEGSVINVVCSRRFEARRELETLGLTWGVDEYVYKVMRSDDIVRTDAEKAWIAQLMIDYDRALLSTEDELGNTVLHHAAMQGNLTVIRTLLDNGADAHAQSAYGTTPLGLAEFCGKASVVTMLSSTGGTQ
eukprot:TRINITY_DN42988_c0_g1_i1.p1 TRINITY_DN42988_c0_g1~~TRINITY_DN42988_c0_g1_i1.p1  ORF type:complete len:197 (+),score=54.69 TRINITY_DN42988_c0_g1_i1:3-593(+)